MFIIQWLKNRDSFIYFTGKFLVWNYLEEDNSSKHKMSVHKSQQVSLLNIKVGEALKFLKEKITVNNRFQNKEPICIKFILLTQSFKSNIIFF